VTVDPVPPIEPPRRKEEQKEYLRLAQASLLVMTYEEIQRNLKAFADAGARLHIVA